jgi:hypothetical protein
VYHDNVHPLIYSDGNLHYRQTAPNIIRTPEFHYRKVTESKHCHSLQGQIFETNYCDSRAGCAWREGCYTL